MVAVLPFVAGCAFVGPDRTPAMPDGGDFYLDAQSCRTQAAFKPAIRLNTSGIGELELDAGYDDQQYRHCMVVKGWAPKVVDETAQAVSECRTRSQPAERATMLETGPHLEDSVAAKAFQECMRNRGIDGTVVVKPLQSLPPPSAP